MINNWRDHTSFKLWLKCPLFCYRGVILMLQNFPTVFWNLWKIWRHTQVRDSRNSRPFTNTCVHSFIHSFIHHHAQPYSFWIHSSCRFAQNCGNLSINFSKMLAQNCGLLGLPYMYICILILRSLFLFSKVCLSIHSFSRFAPLLWYY